MTKENQKRLYDHYVATGQKENVEMMLKAYPEFAEEPKKEKSKKSE